jgi:formylglycine-generating enzyme required for sulfatase activity
MLWTGSWTRLRKEIKMKSSLGIMLLFLIWPANLGSAFTIANSKSAPPPNLSAGKQFRDCDSCPEMIVAPAGTFTIGSPPNEPGRRDNEGPQLNIRIGQPFAVGKYEVTRQQYEDFLRSTNRPVSGNCMTDRRKPGTWAVDAETNFHDPGFSQAGSHPAACVSWNDAKAYIAWLNAKTGGGYRLLTEAEWEYLARAGSTAAYPWGATIHDGCTHMNGFDRVIVDKKGDLYKGEAVSFANCSDGYLNTSPVGSYAPNAFGIYDMIGNLAEWVEDCLTQSYASMQSDGTPATGDCSKRMVRGGSWGTQPRQLRSAERIRYSPADVDDSVGIRVAKTLPRKQ